MEKNKYKILVLSDLRTPTTATLKSTINLAKMVGGAIEFFCVKKPTDVVKQENQLSAIRNINSEFSTADKNIKTLTEALSKEHGLAIGYKIALGNVKDEIAKRIKAYNPDIIVLGKRKPKLFGLTGNGITRFVLKMHKGMVMIADKENVLEPSKELSLGVLNGAEQAFNTDFMDDLIAHAQKPVKAFKVGSVPKAKQHQAPTNIKAVEYVFEQGDGSIKNLDKYLSKNNINLLFVDSKAASSGNNSKTGVRHLIKNLNVSLLLMSA